MFDGERVETRIQEAITAGKLVGLALAVVDGDRVVYARGFGATSVEAPALPVTPDTLFAFGSISKTILATLILRLVEQGQLDLDRPVIEYLPGFTFSDAARGSRITLRRLLSHTSGLPGAGKDWGPCDPQALRRFIWEELSQHALIADPGEIYQYSSTAITLAGYLAEVVTGRSYRETVKELVLEPLEMQRTTWEHRVAMTYPLALPHEIDGEGKVRVIHRFSDNVSGEPSGFGIGSTRDLAHLAILHLNLGRFKGRAVLSPGSIAEMHRRHTERHVSGAAHVLSGVSAGYGLGVMVGEYKGERVVRHGGTQQSFNCFFELVPDRGTGFVLQVNYCDEENLMQIVVAIYNHLLGFPEGSGVRLHPPERAAIEDKASWPQKLGVYMNVEYGQLAQVTAQAEHLVLEYQGSQHLLETIGQDRYYFEGTGGWRTPVAFLHEKDGQMSFLTIWGNPFGRIQVDPSYIPDPEAWRRFPGVYVDYPDPDGRQQLVLRLQHGKLIATLDGQDSECKPLNGDMVFLSDHGLIEFQVEPEGFVPALIVGKATRYRRVDPI